LPKSGADSRALLSSQIDVEAHAGVCGEIGDPGRGVHRVGDWTSSWEGWGERASLLCINLPDESLGGRLCARLDIEWLPKTT
jgi:hypothetical protein